MRIEPFGTLADGSAVSAYTLCNGSGMAVQVLDYGCIIASLCVPDRRGRAIDVVQGYDRLDRYVEDITLCGAIVGRHAGRVAHGRFTLKGRDYQLPATYNVHHMHGGETGFQKRLWKHVPDGNQQRLLLTYCAQDGEEGYPGRMEATVCYEVGQDNRLTLRYAATCDQDTIVNLTNHSYFNLSGDLSSSILSHELWLSAPTYVENDETGLSTGRRCPVEGTPFDFRTLSAIESKLDMTHPSLRQAGGYDHYFPFAPALGEPCAALYSPRSNVHLRVFSDQPGLHLYSANKRFSLPGKEGAPYPPHSALCLESQHIANSMNLQGYPTAVLPANAAYRQETVWAFGLGASKLG